MARPGDWWVLDLPGDPVPGDPGTVTDVARTWSRVADDADTARGQIVSLLGDQAVMAWVGKAGDAFRSHSSKLPGQLQKCAESYSQAAGALSTWSSQLAVHQQSADHALVLGRQALDELDAARQQLNAAQGNAAAAQTSVQGYSATTRQAASDPSVPKPDPAAVQAAVNRASAAAQALSAAQHAVGDAQARLDAAKRMAEQAAAARDGDGRATAAKLHAAADAGIPADSFWHKLGDDLAQAWHVLVEVAKVVVVIASVIAIVVGGPIAWVAFAAAMIILADTVARYSQGQASMLDVGLAALGCIPGEGVLEDLGVIGSIADDTNAVRQATDDTVTAAHDLDDPPIAAGHDPSATTDPDPAAGPDPSSPVWRNDNNPLYRSDNRPPEDIFREGFQPKDPNNTDLDDFVRHNTPSNFVSTTRDPELYQSWPADYRYTVDAPGGIDVNATIPDNPFYDESEIAFPGGLRPESVVGVHPVLPGRTLGDWIPNPGYRPVR